MSITGKITERQQSLILQTLIDRNRRSGCGRDLPVTLHKNQRQVSC